MTRILPDYKLIQACLESKELHEIETKQRSHLISVDAFR
jgi:hypothetical protein